MILLRLKLIYDNIRDISKDTLTLMLGTLLAGIIPLLLQPILKRIYTPEDFGNLEVYLRFFNILVAISSLKYENAIVLSKSKSDSVHALVLSVLISSLLFIVLSISFTSFNSDISANIPGLSEVILWTLPISVLCYSIFNSSNLFLIKRKKFLTSASNKVIRRGSEGLTQVILGSLRMKYGLLIGDVTGNVIQSIYAAFRAKKEIQSPFRIRREKLIKIISIFHELPKYTLLPSLLNSFVLGSLTFLILDKYSMAQVGYLEFTQKILAIPAVFLSVAISQVVFQRVSSLVNRKQKIIPFISSITILLFIVSTVFLTIVLIFSAEIYTMVGGETWKISGHYANILVFSSCATLIFSPLGKVLIALRKFKVNSAWEIGKFCVIMILFFIDDLPIINFLSIYALIVVVFYFAYGIIIFLCALKYQKRLEVK